jgi:hypothetical protein
MLCRELYTRGDPGTAGPTVVPPWYSAESGGGLPWPVDRVLAALHVYVHLATFWFAALAGAALPAEERGAAGARHRRCLRKGRYLLGALQEPMRPALGPDGGRFVEFLARGLHDVLRATADRPRLLDA